MKQAEYRTNYCLILSLFVFMPNVNVTIYSKPEAFKTEQIGRNEVEPSYFMFAFTDMFFKPWEKKQILKCVSQ